MKLSLRTKLILMIVILSAILSVAAFIASMRVIRHIIDTHYKERSASLAESISMALDGSDVRTLRDAVLSIYESTEPKISSEDWGSDEWNT